MYTVSYETDTALHCVCSGVAALILHQYPEDDLPVSESIAAYYDDAGYQQFRSTVPVTCLDGASWLSRAQELVDDAQDYILVDAFLANYTELTQGFYHALSRKQQEGVRVYVLYDHEFCIVLY